MEQKNEGTGFYPRGKPTTTQQDNKEQQFCLMTKMSNNSVQALFPLPMPSPGPLLPFPSSNFNVFSSLINL